MAWELRYASHLGYRPPFRPLFLESAVSPDAAAQVEYAAKLGFAGVQYARAVSQPKVERTAVRAALERHSLETGCILYASREVTTAPLWGTTDPAARATWEKALREACDVAAELNGRYLVVISAADSTIPLAIQQTAFVENLKRAAELAAARNVTLLLENLARTTGQNTLLSHIGDAYAVVRAVGHPHVRLIFDTSHVQIMDGDLLTNMHAVWDAVEVVQLADNPKRLEPGTGEINFPNLLRAIRELGFRGLVELEHDWSQPDRATEQRGVASLQSMEGAAR
jgi:hydroxypyruvate isomerase